MVRALPDDGKRYETVYGELLVTPAPGNPHQFVLGELFYLLRRYLERNSDWRVVLSPSDISWAPDILVQPDLFVMAASEALTLDWRRTRTLSLAIEVLSPSSKRQDRFTKRRVYQSHGVASYWVVDPENRAIEVWTPDAITPVVERERVVWQPAGAAEPMVLGIPELFSKALDR